MRITFTTFLTFIFFFSFGQDDQNPCLINQDFHIVILGSSTAAGTGPSSADSTWVNRYRNYLQSINPNNTVTNLAIGGTTTYHIMPDWFSPPPNRPATNPNNNITQAVALEADAVIVNMPSNDASNFFGVDEQMFNFLTIASVADSFDIPIWVCTTQPKTPFGVTQDSIQVGVRDSVLSAFGNMAIDFWNGIALPSNDIDPIYDSGDGTHLNDAAHAILLERVKSKNILSNIFQTSSDVDFSITKYSILNPGICGDTSTLIQAVITNLGATSIEDIFIEQSIYNFSNSTTSIITDTIYGGLSACEADTIEFMVNTLLAEDYSFFSILNSAGDTIFQNDTSQVLMYNPIAPPIILPKNDTICQGESAFLSFDFENTDTIFWFENLTDSTPIAGGNSLTTLPTDTSQMYFAEAVSGDLFYKNSLFTTDISNKNWNGVMIDLVAHEDLTIDSFSIKFFDEGTQGVVAYYKNGSYEGFENEASAWTLWGIDSLDVLTSGNFYTISYGNFFLAAGDTLGIYFHLQNGGARLSYNDATDWVSRSTDELEIRSGSGITYTFGIIYFPRDWNGSIFYHHGFNPQGDCSSGRVPVEVVVSEPVVDLGEDMALHTDEYLILDGGSGFASYFWNGVEGGPTFQVDTTNFGVGVHEIILEAIDAWGCVATDTILVTLKKPLSIGSLEFIEKNYQIYPNPTSDFFWVKNLKSGISEIQIYDLLGKKIQEEKFGGEIQINVENFTPGVYILKIKNDAGWGVQRIIKP